jgi:host factor-I protein
MAPEAKTGLTPHVRIKGAVLEQSIGMSSGRFTPTLARGLEVAAQSTATLQDTFLAYLQDHGAEVTMFLVNGIRLQGRVGAFDRFAIQLVRGNSSQLVYKHTITAINPVEPIQLFDPNAER